MIILTQQQQHFSMGTVVSGELNVIIKGVGSFRAKYSNSSLRVYAGNVYAILTRKALFDNGDFFELVSFDPDKGELVVKTKNKT